MSHHPIHGGLEMDAFVEQIEGQKVFIRLENGETKEVFKPDLPRGIKVDEMLLYENGKFIRDPDALSKKEAMSKQLDELTKKVFTGVTTYTDKHPKK
jgi:hypothetical protein